MVWNALDAVAVVPEDAGGNISGREQTVVVLVGPPREEEQSRGRIDISRTHADLDLRWPKGWCAT